MCGIDNNLLGTTVLHLIKERYLLKRNVIVKARDVAPFLLTSVKFHTNEYERIRRSSYSELVTLNRERFLNIESFKVAHEIN